MKRILLSTAAVAAALAVLGAANAADLSRPAQMPVKAPAYIAPLYTWTGFYIGGNIGYGWGDGSGTYTAPGVRGVLTSGPISGSGNGVIGGLQAGYNWQTGPVVFGVETDFQGSGVSGNFNGAAPGNKVTGSSKTPWFGTIRGRVGYAFNNTWLVYVTGGGAYAQTKITGVSAANGPFSASNTAWTYTVGGGVEAFIAPQWSVKGEYLFMGDPDSVPLPANTRITGHSTSNIVRVGFNYHF